METTGAGEAAFRDLNHRRCRLAPLLALLFLCTIQPGLLGCAAYLAKPMNRQTLLRVMSELLAQTAPSAPVPHTG